MKYSDMAHFKNKILLAMLSLSFFLSCGNNKSDDQDPFRTEAPKTQNETPMSDNNILDSTPVSTIDSQDMRSTLPTPEKPTSVYPVGTFKTYPEIVRSLFGEGSNKDEVLIVMGKPELEEPDNSVSGSDRETWYYGNIEIHFKNGLVIYANVDGLNADQKIEKYVDFMDLLTSIDPIERKFGHMLFERGAQNSRFR
jgi:hypothetical protein